MKELLPNSEGGTVAVDPSLNKHASNKKWEAIYKKKKRNTAKKRKK